MVKKGIFILLVIAILLIAVFPAGVASAGCKGKGCWDNPWHRRCYRPGADHNSHCIFSSYRYSWILELLGGR